jgi:hypothetical protein
MELSEVNEKERKRIKNFSGRFKWKHKSCEIIFVNENIFIEMNRKQKKIM